MEINKIYIDGVNVAECKYFQQEDNEHTCGAEEGNGAVVGCRACDNCYFKQLQHLKQENEGLKRKYKSKKYILENTLPEASRYAMKCGEFRQALEEIRKIVEPIKENTCFGMNCGAVDWILNEINEVLND